MTSKAKSYIAPFQSTSLKVSEMKKKLTLLEGQRKAIYTSSEKEKALNKAKEIDIEKEVIQAKKDLIFNNSTKGILLDKMPLDLPINKRVMERLSPSSAMDNQDYKVAELQKKLNKLKYRSQEKQRYLDILVKSFNNLESKEFSDSNSPGQNEAEIRTRYLENEIHKTSLKASESEMVQAKYQNILDMLKADKRGYAAATDELEAYIKQQNAELKQLQNDYDEAIMFRDSGRLDMKEKEEEYQQESKDRLNKVVDMKTQLKDKRDTFMRIVSDQSEHPDSKPTITGSDASSLISGSAGEGEEIHIGASTRDNVSADVFEEAFTRMARSAGVSKIEEVIERFKTQKMTSRVLKEQSENAETDIRDLGVLKDQLEQETTATQFKSQDDTVGQQKKIEILNDKITINEDRLEKTRDKIAILERKHELLLGCFTNITELLMDQSYDEDVPLDQLVEVCLCQVETQFSERLKGKDLQRLQYEVGLRRDKEEEDVFQIAEDERNGRKQDTVETETVDEEEVPTRISLRRQADILINMKKKTGGRR